jgi:hypothetical protein
MIPPSARSNRRPRRRDQVIVSIAAVIWIVGTVWGTGLIGGGVSSQGDGLFTDSATLIAPKGPAFSIWSVIYLGLSAYVVWQWLPASRDSRWTARTRLPAAASIALNGVWLGVVQADLVWLSVIVILGIAVSLGLVLRAAAALPRETPAVDLVVGATFGLYLGWVCVATCANIASWLVGLGVPVETPTSEGITVAVLVVVVALAGYLIHRATHLSLRLGIAASVVWGTAWISAGRLGDELESTTVAYAAAVAAVIVAVATVAILLRTRPKVASG